MTLAQLPIFHISPWRKFVGMKLAFLLLFSIPGLVSAQAEASAIENWLPATYHLLGSEPSADGYFVLQDGTIIHWRASQNAEPTGVLHIEVFYETEGIPLNPHSAYLKEKQAVIFAPQIEELCPENMLPETGK
jgi:hypothetical protein